MFAENSWKEGVEFSFIFINMLGKFPWKFVKWGPSGREKCSHKKFRKNITILWSAVESTNKVESTKMNLYN